MSATNLTGTVEVITAAGVSSWRPALVRALEVASERALFRAPYGTAWHLAGDARRGVERFELEAIVTQRDSYTVDATEPTVDTTSYTVDMTGFGIAGPESIAYATGRRDLLRATLAAATEIRSRTFGRTPVDGLEAFTSAPIQGGYRVNATLIGGAPLAFVVGTSGANSDYAQLLAERAGFVVERVTHTQALEHSSEPWVVIAPGLFDTSLYSIDAPLVCANDTGGRLVTLGLFTGTPTSNTVSLSGGLQTLGTHPILGPVSGSLNLADSPSLGYGTQQADQVAAGVTVLARSKTDAARVGHVAGISAAGHRATSIVLASSSGVVDSTPMNDGLVMRAIQWAAGRLPLA